MIHVNRNGVIIKYTILSRFLPTCSVIRAAYAVAI
jgi:hypothetical protein